PNQEPGAKRNQPHIIFILTDDQGFNDIGYHNPTIKTPTLDKLAAEGVRLENYYVQPICTPSRSQLITGRYATPSTSAMLVFFFLFIFFLQIPDPHRPPALHHQAQPAQLSAFARGHPARAPPPGRILHPPGGQMAPGLLQEGVSSHPERLRHLLRLLDRQCGLLQVGLWPRPGSVRRLSLGLVFLSPAPSYLSCDGPGVCGYDLHDGEGVVWGQEGKYSTALFTRRARQILESHDPAERPLFLLLSLQAVHTPLQTPKSYIYPYRDMTNVARRKLAAMVSTVDEAVRNVTYALRKYGYYRNSVIIYSTDNGAQPFTGGSNWPLRGRKGTYWEGGIRGVAFVHSPLLRRRRRVSKALLHITDWFPTLVGLAGGNVSQIQQPGSSFVLDPDALKLSWCRITEMNQLFQPVGKKLSWLVHDLLRIRLQVTFDPSERSFDAVSRHPRRAGVWMALTPGPASVKGGTRRARRSSTTSTLCTNRWPRPPPGAPREAQNASNPPELQTSESLWDTSTQAAIRVGDWKLLTGYPGHGDWVPPQVGPGAAEPRRNPQLARRLTASRRQVLPTLPGRWWNLERHMWSPRQNSTHKNIWLFNITADPCERHDLADRRPDVVQRLLARLAFHNRTAVPVYFPPDDPRADPSRHGGAWVPWVK
ncbi:unnamed protein product, partial [Tetraodon nigroviridis]